MSDNQMRAVRIHGYGEVEVLREERIAVPEPGPGQVLIAVHAAGINPVDWKTRRGQGVARKQLDEPLIIGWDVSGVVAALGAGAEGFAVGDEVYGMINFPADHGGAYAEYAVAPAGHLAPKPPSLSHAEAAALPLAALTAWQALLETAGLRAGQRLLIHAAAGGVGHLAVQIAKARGAHVTGTASGGNEGYLRELGVDAFVNYRETRFEEAVAPVDIVLDTMSGETRERSFGVVKPGGWLVSILGAPDAAKAEAAGINARGIMVRPEAGQLRELAALVESGQLRPTIEREFPLSEIRAAHELVETGHVRGKVVVLVRES
ncbi:MAG TPA: NADP-dependent oxidoreductase [Herpetosiphonaceae bacterium]